MKTKLEQRLFHWGLDEDGDLVLSIAGIVHVIYYKWHDTAILKFGRKRYPDAPKSVWRAIHSRDDR